MLTYSLLPSSESDSSHWHLLPILLPDIAFLGHPVINCCFAKCILVFLHSTLGSVSGLHNISLLSDPISESKDQFQITSSEMKLAVSARVTIDQVLLNDHKLMPSANFLNINWFGTYFLCILISQFVLFRLCPFQQLNYLKIATNGVLTL